MRLLLALLLAAGFVQMAGAQDPPHFLPPSASAVRLTIELVPARVALNDEVTFKVSITNVSASPQYLSGDTLDTIQYAVRSVSGKSVRPYSDPPPPPRVPPVQYQDLIWLRPGTSIVFYQHIPVSALGITKPGRYSVSGALSSYIFSKEQWLAQHQSIFLTFASWVPLEVVRAQSTLHLGQADRRPAARAVGRLPRALGITIWPIRN